MRSRRYNCVESSQIFIRFMKERFISASEMYAFSAHWTHGRGHGGSLDSQVPVKCRRSVRTGRMTRFYELVCV